MKSYPVEFRQKIIDCYFNEPISQRQLARKFNVALSFVEKILKQYRETGDLSPRTRRSKKPVELPPSCPKPSGGPVENFWVNRIKLVSGREIIEGGTTHLSGEIEMKPRFKNSLAWEQAEILMQPAFIRVLDNLGKQLDTSSWEGTFEEIQIPYPGYRLDLKCRELSIVVEVWDLCYRVCFLDYPPDTGEENPEIDIDTSLIDGTGNVDWQRLETKARHVIGQLFASLPTGAG
jgi:hypothetical protein